MAELVPAPDAAVSLGELDLEQLDAGHGAPATGVRELGSFGGLTVGVWQMAEGVATDTEADELFVVVSGAGTIEFVDTGALVPIAAGDLVRLRAGSRTRWTITQTLRKLYLTP